MPLKWLINTHPSYHGTICSTGQTSTTKCTMVTETQLIYTHVCMYAKAHVLIDLSVSVSKNVDEDEAT
jgi:hypothetical protein